jgi:hypothetical protein
VPEWREHYEHGHEPDFAYCIGHAKPSDTFATWIEGDEARARFYDWVGIPRKLLAQWNAEQLERERITHVSKIGSP